MTKPKEQNDNFLDLSGASKYTGMKYQTLYKFIVLDKKIDFYKFGKKIMVKKSDINNFINSHLIPKEGGNYGN